MLRQFNSVLQDVSTLRSSGCLFHTVFFTVGVVFILCDPLQVLCFQHVLYCRYCVCTVFCTTGAVFALCFVLQVLCLHCVYAVFLLQALCLHYVF